ncbi:reverse transcriptase family protein [Frigidibacter sp. SD6-1]|uniref:reverse transcriptase family protein n=1 Tax=Frigidibacter sp. SD6-1 TaxID=3032581 RepID=UPI0024DFAAEF|nr:reverse transcriptase family protein [Frigidibacter sp. SD6-1]
MNLSDVLRPFAASLSQIDWTDLALETHLRQRLPTRLSSIARPLARALKHRFPASVAPDTALLLRFLRTRPEAGRILALAKRLGDIPAPPLLTAGFRPDPALATLGLPALDTTEALADWLGLTESQLVRFADLRGLSAQAASHFAGHYRHHLIPKTDGQFRLIEEPKPLMKRLQRHVLRWLLDRVPPHPDAIGFRKGTSCLTGARRHAGEQAVVCFDLTDFFPTIGFSRVYAIFRTLGYPTPVARALTGICTAVTPDELLQDNRIAARNLLTGRHLPQGAPTSPALANLAARALDRRLAGLARRLGASYSRYADDLAFSGDRHVVPTLLSAVPDIVRETGFRLNPAKTRKAHSGQRQTVTGIVVNRHLNLARPVYDEVKAILHRLSDPADPRRRDPAFLAHLDGRISWAEQVNPARARSLRDRFDALALG